MTRHTPPSLIITDPRCMSSVLDEGSVMSLFTHGVIAESRRTLACAIPDPGDDTLVTAHDYW